MTRPGFAELCASLLAEGRDVRFRASGRSMAPAFRDGDLLTVSPKPARAVQVGEVALYRAGQGLVAHRVIARVPERSQFLCRGDSPGGAAECVAEEDVLGVVVDVIRDTPFSSLAAWRRRLGDTMKCLMARSLAPGRGRESPHR